MPLNQTLSILKQLMKITEITVPNNRFQLVDFFTQQNSFQGLLLRDFLSKKRLSLAVTRAKEFGFTWRERDTIGNLGAHVYLYPNNRDAYFKDCAQYKILREWIFEKEDPTVKLIKLFQQNHFDIDIARSFSGHYSYGVIKVQQVKSRLHVDDICRLSSWGVAQDQKRQFSCVLMMNKSLQGGQLRIYNRRYQPSDVSFAYNFSTKANDGVREEIVSGCEFTDVDLNVGDIFIFPTDYYHQVLPSEGSELRTTALVFLSLKSNQKIEAFI